MILSSALLESEIDMFLNVSAHGMTVTSYFLCAVTSFFGFLLFSPYRPISAHTFPHTCPNICTSIPSCLCLCIFLFLLDFTHFFSSSYSFIPPRFFLFSFPPPFRIPGLFFVLSDGTRLGIHCIM